MNKKIVSFAVAQMLKRMGIDEAFKCFIVLDCGKQFQSGKRIDNLYMWDSYITNVSSTNLEQHRLTVYSSFSSYGRLLWEEAVHRYGRQLIRREVLNAPVP